MSEKNIHIAGNRQDIYTPYTLFAGDADIITQPDVIAQSGTVIPQWAPLTRDGTSGKLRILAATTEKVVAIAPYALDATAADVTFSVYKGGYFNIGAIVWPTIFNTNLLKLGALVAPMYARAVPTPA